MTEKKVLIGIVTIILIIGMFSSYYWYTEIRPWDIRELDEKKGRDNPYFDDDWAGKTHTIIGEVTDIEENTTSQGDIYFIELDDYEGLELVEWNDCPYEVGDEIEKEVHFRMGSWNGKKHVYCEEAHSPSMLGLAIYRVIWQTHHMMGIDFDYSEFGDGNIRVKVENATDDQYGVPLALNETNCSLYHGFESAQKDIRHDEYYGGETPITELSLTEPQGNSKIKFFNENNNTVLDTGDYFEIYDLEKPDKDMSITSYHLVLKIGDDDEPWRLLLVMNDEGLLTMGG